ncbi:MAG: ethylbenzene dehydrogenase-related protein [Desulfurococcales archaeon]|nr:ethylbenzene dehydrogenase-related protein [Desulfurococcales archaeon]
MRRETRIAAIIGILLIFVASALAVMGIVPVTAQTNAYTAKYVQGTIPLDPTAELWQQADKGNAVLVAQLLTYPQRLDTQPRQVSYAAVSNGTHFAIYIEWSDETKDVPPVGSLDQFPDAVAVQFPVLAGEQPYVCMGMPDNPVNIVLWRSNGTVENLVAGSGYGTKGQQEQEARGLQKTPTSPIVKLPPEEQVWTASASYSDGKWRVVLARPTGGVGNFTPSLDPGSEVSIAFALWDGSKYERAGSKVTSGWMTLKLEAPAGPTEAQTVTATETQAAGTVTETVTQTTTVTETVAAATGSVKAAIVGFLAALVVAIIMLALLYRKGALKGV